MSTDRTSSLEAIGVTHDYSGVVVLRDVDFALSSGAVHALAGENGSGKSTLIRILTGALAPRAGRLLIDGHEMHLGSPKGAQRHGIAVVHQDYNVFPDLTVAENVLGANARLPRRQWSPLVDRTEVGRRVRTLFETLEISIPVDALVRSLGPVERKFIEIARAMLLTPRFLILDEPTASLEPRSAASVLELIERLRAQDIGVCFVSHRLDEVLRIADRMTVLRDGAVVGRLAREQATEAGLAKLIVGDKAFSDGAESARTSASASAAQPEAVMRVKEARVFRGSPPVSFELRRGEIFGFTGLLGSGATEMLRMLGGATPLAGELEVSGRRVQIRTPRDASRAGIGLIPEDRKALGIIPDASVAINISLPSLSDVSRAGMLQSALIEQRANTYQKKLGIRFASIHSPVRTLSGGNTQKVMIAKWLASGVDILAVEEPTHGIDIGTKGQVHALLRDFAARGGAILVASTDVQEVLALCDRIAIFRHGEMTDVLATTEFSDSVAAGKAESESEHLLERLITSGARAT